MKKLLFLAIAAALFIFNSCTSIKQIGKLNMVSQRNIDSDFDYVSLSTYTGGSKKELKKSKAPNIETAISETVKNTPGGEFLMNVKIYLINGKYFAVEGDVWGHETKSFKGFEVGNEVTWKKIGGYEKGIIKSLKDSETCLIELSNGKIIEKKYIDISNIE